MLQKGFLKSHEEKGNSRRVRTSRTLLFTGVIVVLAALGYLMMNMQRADQILTIWLLVMIAGICLIFVGIWINFFTQNRNRRR